MSNPSPASIVLTTALATTIESLPASPKARVTEEVPTPVPMLMVSLSTPARIDTTLDELAMVIRSLPPSNEISLRLLLLITAESTVAEPVIVPPLLLPSILKSSSTPNHCSRAERLKGAMRLAAARPGAGAAVAAAATMQSRDQVPPRLVWPMAVVEADTRAPLLAAMALSRAGLRPSEQHHRSMLMSCRGRRVGAAARKSAAVSRWRAPKWMPSLAAWATIARPE